MIPLSVDDAPPRGPRSGWSPRCRLVGALVLLLLSCGVVSAPAHAQSGAGAPGGGPAGAAPAAGVPPQASPTPGAPAPAPPDTSPGAAPRPRGKPGAPAAAQPPPGTPANPIPARPESALPEARPSVPPITVPPVRTHLGHHGTPGVELRSNAEQVPSLIRVVEMVREKGPRVMLGRAQIATARAGYAGARLAPLANPYLELTVDKPFGTGADNRDPNLLAQLWLPVELFGQRGRRIAETDAAVVVTERALELGKALSTGEAVRAYGAVVVGSARLKVLGDLMEVSRSEAKSYEERYAAGDATIQDANLARVDLARYAVLLEEAKGDTAAAYFELNRLTGGAYALPPDSPLRPPQVDVKVNYDDLPSVRTPRAEADYHARVKERFKREALGPVSLILQGGRDDLGSTKLGGGLGYTFPVVRRNQGEQARAEAERSRALVESRVNRALVESRLSALGIELTQIRSALDMLRDQAEPAAIAAVESATAMRRAGKGELLAVLTSRRDLALVQLRRLELATREWHLLAELTSITGKIQ